MQPQSILHVWFTELTPQQHFAKDAALDESIQQQRGQVLPFAYFTPDLWSRAQSFSSCFCNLRKCHRPIWHVNTQRR